MLFLHKSLPSLTICFWDLVTYLKSFANLLILPSIIYILQKHWFKPFQLLEIMNKTQRDNIKKKFNHNWTTSRPAEINIKSLSENMFKVQVTWLLRESLIFTLSEKNSDWTKLGFKSMFKLKFQIRFNTWAEQTLKTFFKFYNNQIQTYHCSKSTCLRNKLVRLIM